MAGSTGLEPAASGVTGRRSNQLNYDPKLLCGSACWTPSGATGLCLYPAEAGLYVVPADAVLYVVSG